jgi:CubicO group peptidase (beta-lactamase class C family)
LPPDSFGHTGFTGTCVWIDPNRQHVFILLTNRTHAHALPFANINEARREFNRLAADLLK